MSKLFIVAEVRLYREGLAMTLAREPGIDVAGTAGTWAAALEEIRRLRPDVILLDLAMPLGPAAARAVHVEFPDTKVVALAVQDAEADVLAWAEAGMAGYVTRDATVDDLVATVHRAARGEMEVPPRITAKVVQRLSQMSADRGALAFPSPLTTREIDVIRLIGKGLSNKEIAKALSIALPTVKNHVHNILEKLKIRRRADAVLYLERGLLPPTRTEAFGR